MTCDHKFIDSRHCLKCGWEPPRVKVNPSNTPIDKLLDAVDWEETGNVSDGSPLPFATHEGVLSIGDVELKVYQLSNGQRIIDKASFEDAIGVLSP